MNYIGIDPGGSSGGLAMITYDEKTKSKTLRAIDFKKHTISDVMSFLANIDVKKTFAVIEKVHSMPGNGVASQFKFGENFGMLQGVLHGLGIPFVLTPPQTWMKHYSMKRNKSESKTEWKRRLRGVAEALFPQNKVINDISDAILISNFAISQYYPGFD